MTPIYNHRTIVGYAKTQAGAVRVIRSMIQHIPPGWRVSVRMRDTSLISLPAGWVYSVHP